MTFLNTPTCADVFDFVEGIPDNSIQTVVTSPPYFGLRNYHIASRIWGGDPGCIHSFEGEYSPPTKVGKKGYDDPKWEKVVNKMNKIEYTQLCSQCWAWEGSLGSEPWPGMFIAANS